MPSDLSRFIIAQERHFDIALSEITAGKKRGCWMWYIFPQYKGLGQSETSRYYAIENLHEAEEYLNHPLLGLRLRQINEALLLLNENNPNKIFGSPDDMKLKSSVTLFSLIDFYPQNLFIKVLSKFFDGQRDGKTLDLIKKSFS